MSEELIEMEKKIYQKDYLVWLTNNRLVTEERRVSCSSSVNKESSPKEEMNLTIVSHNRSTEEVIDREGKVSKHLDSKE